MFDVREPSIEALRSAPVRFRYADPKVRRVLVDSFDAANADNQAKLARMVAGNLAQFQRVAAFAFAHVK